MKIEKVNDNQIRCTLTREDLDERQLKISEIAYGSEKAKMLFKDVMQQAHYEYGFEAENIPLMIEAIPMNTGCIVFIITKVEDPEELDTRFSRFAPSVHDEDVDDYEDDVEGDGLGLSDIVDNPFEASSPANLPGDLLDALPQAAGEVFDLFKKITDKAREANQNKKANGELPAHMDAHINNSKAGTGQGMNRTGDGSASRNDNKKASANQVPSIRLYSFANLDILVDACKMLGKIYKGESTLYKNPGNGRYFLLLTRGLSDEKDFMKICNLLMEYGSPEPTTSASVAYVEEHYDLLLEEKAVKKMTLL